jgi:hypothetical protein
MKSSRLIIITSAVNNKKFIETQYELLKKYVKGGPENYEFVVFNDAKNFIDFTNEGDITIKKQITETCNKLGITCFEIENEHHRIIQSASHRTADTLNIIFNYQMNRYRTRGDSKYLIIDSDMFLIDYFDINRYNNYSSAVVIQNRNGYKYIWNGIYYMDMSKIKDEDKVNWNLTSNTDTGGMMRNWLYSQLEEGERIPDENELKWKKPDELDEPNGHNTKNLYIIKHLWSLSWNINDINDMNEKKNNLFKFLEKDSRNKNNKYYCEIYDDKFLHLRNGGNWKGDSINFFNNLILELKK